MARVCTVTGRRTKTGNARSHAMNASKRTWKSNVQKVKILVNGKPKNIKKVISSEITFFMLLICFILKLLMRTLLNRNMNLSVIRVNRH